jgi:DNA-dependent protein kinase catalytic subunit
MMDSSWRCVGDQIGAYNKKFAKRFSREISLIVGSSSSLEAKLESLKKLTASKGLGSVKKTHLEGRVALSEFSDWLAHFDPAQYAIELPGSYPKDTEPQSVPLILGCSPDLLVMASKRRPKRITFFCSDGRDYSFLCKGGEDMSEHKFLVIVEVLGHTD